MLGYNPSVAVESGDVSLAVVGANYAAALATALFSAISGEDALSYKGPRVVATNTSGQSIVVEQFASRHKAVEALQAMLDELAQLGPHDWVERHGIFPEFIV